MKKAISYSLSFLNAVIKTAHALILEDVVNGGILSGHIYILEQRSSMIRANT